MLIFFYVDFLLMSMVVTTTCEAFFFLYFLQFPCATQLKREKHTEHFDKVNHDVH